MRPKPRLKEFGGMPDVSWHTATPIALTACWLFARNARPDPPGSTEQWSSPREDNCNLDTSQASSSITDHLMGDTYKPLISDKCI